MRPRRRHRLYHRIFQYFLVFVVMALALAALAGHLLLSDLVRPRIGGHFEARARGLIRELPASDRPVSELQAALERVTEGRRVHAAVFGPDGRRLAFTSVDLAAPRLSERSAYWMTSPLGHVLAVPIGDGRTVVMTGRQFPRPASFLLAVLTLAGVLALASYPVARLVTRRLETLEAGVQRLGQGDLGVRVEVKGNDELTSLASSFNLAAERLQGLVESQRRVLASASHELRSPLARLRMALELLGESPEKRQERVKDAIAEVEELDALVEELMLAGRLELQNAARSDEAVDIGELLSEEAARIGASAEIREAPLHADPRLIRVLLRNLLENAVRHGLGAAVEAGVEPIPGDPAGVRIWVADRGPGIPEAERERIFEPFYRPRGHAETRDGGVGLGLYLVRKIARWYGGTVTIHSREGSGVRFEVVLWEPAG